MPPINMPMQHANKALKCQTCRFFYQGVNNITCRTTREVVADTPACQEYQAMKPSQYQLIQNDKMIREIEKMALLPYRDLRSPEEIMADLKTYYLFNVEDKRAQDYLDEESLGKLALKFQTCQSYMDSVTHLEADINALVAETKGMLKNIRGYLMEHFPDILKGFKNEDDRESFLRIILPRTMNRYDQYSILADRAEKCAANLKQTHFNMVAIQEGAMAIYKTRAMFIDSNRRSQGQTRG